jgi:DNA repair exonuclease SbcCD nuclease subunit
MKKICFALILVMCCTKSYGQLPAAPEVKGENYSFGIMADRFGDEHKGIYSKLLVNLLEKEPDFIMCTGDMIAGYADSQKEALEQWFEFDGLMKDCTVPFYPTAGNHDVSTGTVLAEWINRYEVLYYSFEVNDDMFWVIGTDLPDRRGRVSARQAEYFARVLKDKNPRRLFIFMHTPIWKTPQESGFDQIFNIIEGHKYYIFSAHEHQFSHTSIDGNDCFVLGTSGGDADPSVPGEIYHYMYLTINKDSVRIQSHGIDDQQYEVFK